MPTEPRRRSLAVTVVLWLARAALALVFLGAGVTKLVGDPAMVTMFGDIGAGQWLRHAVGALEVLGAVGVLVPRTSALAAVGLALLGTMGVVYLFLRFATVVRRVLGESGTVLATRIAGLLLSAIAVQMVANAVQSFVTNAV